MIKRILILLVLAVGVIAQAHAISNDARCLVLYYTYSGVTQTLAEAISNDCNGTLLEVVDHGNYPRPESSTTYTYANNERTQIDAGVWPEINTSVEKFDDYDAVIICTPLWNGKMANPMLAFLHNHADKLASKQVALAVTSWSSGITNVVTDAHNQLPDAIFVGDPLHINYNNRSNISAMASAWVGTLEFEVENPLVKMRVIVGDKTFTATLADNATAESFSTLLPLTLNMIELNGNEKYNYMSSTLPTNASCPGTIQTGDIMLYGSSCVVLFYKTFTTSYSYTRIGAVDDPEGLAEALGTSNVTVKFELGEDTPQLGDVNGDGEVSITDVTALIDALLCDATVDKEVADVNQDDTVSITDVTALIDILLTAI